ncbi:putative DNA-binding transcriptional regulator YafY [Paenibacillus sp. RC254]|uniref:helix-turn-helix transcriptional regulator n=1 Tax=unclassified Paenibacillus TaxID=185978 RepID=UPI0024BA1803|nr:MULTISPECIES: YafY family protein [unclassified Paenibacillus]
MNKTERLLAIVLELQRSRVLKAEELAARVETSVRTIYRDIQALSEAGIPIVGLPGSGYSLMEGYFLPPISFTMEEALTLLIGSDFIEHHFDSNLSKNARSSRAKIETILPQKVREEAGRNYSNIRLLPPEEPAAGEPTRNDLAIIRIAMLDGKKVRFKYRKGVKESNGYSETIRTVAPFGLVLLQGMWMLLARCDLREDIRHFKISRISDLVITDEPFQLPEDFNLHEYRRKDDRHIHIRALFKAELAGKVQETNNYYMEDAELCPDGYVVNFRVRQPEELLSWILNWGSDVIVLEPESFRDQVHKEIQKMLERY